MVKPQRHDLLEILEDRHSLRSTIVTSQLPIEAWHEYPAIPPWPTPSSTASFTTPTRSV